MEASIKQQKTEIWPKAIIATFILFGCFIGYMVVKSFSYDVNMVKNDYYQDELNYQSHLDDVNRGNLLKQNLTLLYQKESRLLNIQLPSLFEKEKIKGELVFFRQSDRKLDRKVNLNLDNNNFQSINTSALASGYWKAKLRFEFNGLGYYKEIEFNKQ